MLILVNTVFLSDIQNTSKATHIILHYTGNWYYFLDIHSFFLLSSCKKVDSVFVTYICMKMNKGIG